LKLELNRDGVDPRLLRHHHSAGQGHLALMASLDLSAAFDTVDKSILIKEVFTLSYMYAVHV